MHLRYRLEAAADIADAFRWYDSQALGLGRDFERAVAAIGVLIEQYPKAFPLVHRDLRRALLARFPYAVYYRQFDQDTVEVVACLHTRRDPAVAHGRAGDV